MDRRLVFLDSAFRWALGVQLAYAEACAALRPRVLARPSRSGAVLLAIYALLLWNPMSFEAPTMGRVIRQQIYTPLALAVIAGLVALYRRLPRKSVRRNCSALGDRV